MKRFIQILSLVVFVFQTQTSLAQANIDVKDYQLVFDEPDLNAPAKTKTTTNSETTEPKDFKLQENTQVLAIIDSLVKKNENINKTKGYRISVYNGTNKDELKKAKEYIYSLYPNINIISEYKQPQYKMRIGDFITRYDAFEVLAKINTRYPDALIIPEVVNINPPTANE